jgi:uncharacterized protein (DUF952 family)
MHASTIYHVTSHAAWQDALQRGEYTADSLIQDGFIHCSEKDQIAGVLERYYSGQKHLPILVIDAVKVNAEIRYEGLPGGELYPHIYGALPILAVDSVIDSDQFLYETGGL